MKRILMVMICLCVFASSWAHAEFSEPLVSIPSPFMNSEVYVPQFKGGPFITLTGFYAFINNDDLSYQLLRGNIAGPGIADFVQAAGIRTLEPRYEWGFTLEGGFTFPDSGNDIRVDWTQLELNEKGPSLITQGIIDAPSVLTTSPLITTTNGNFKIDFDTVDANVGQNIYFGRLLTRIFSGIEYADFKKDIVTNATFVIIATTVDFDLVNATHFTTDSSYRGVGPELGFNARYPLLVDSNGVGGLGLDGELKSALLIGEAKTSGSLLQFMFQPLVVQAFNVSQNFAMRDEVRIVPALDAKLGVDYSLPIFNSMLKLAGGYEAARYFNALDRITGGDAASAILANPNLVVGFTPLPYNRRTGDLYIAGPYVSLTVAF